MIEILILYILTKRDLTLYSLKKRIEEFFSPYIRISLGALSPAISRLEKNASITTKISVSKNGKPSKYCSLTNEGTKYLKNLLINFEHDNPSSLITNIKLALMCSEVLSNEQKKVFKARATDHLVLYIGRLESSLADQYSGLDEFQKNVLSNDLLYLKEFKKILND